MERLAGPEVQMWEGLGELRCSEWVEWMGCAWGVRNETESSEEAGPRSSWVSTLSWGARANGRYMSLAVVDQIWVSVRLLTSLAWIPKSRREKLTVLLPCFRCYFHLEVFLVFPGALLCDFLSNWHTLCWFDN